MRLCLMQNRFWNLLEALPSQHLELLGHLGCPLLQFSPVRRRASRFECFPKIAQRFGFDRLTVKQFTEGLINATTERERS